MASNYNRLIPRGDQARDILANNRLAKNGSTQNVTDCTVGALPHFLQAKFLYTALVGGDGRALDAHVVFLDGLRRIDGDLVIGRIAVLHAQIIVFDVQIHIGKDQFVFDKGPNDPSHFIAVEFYDGVRNRNFIHMSVLPAFLPNF